MRPALYQICACRCDLFFCQIRHCVANNTSSTEELLGPLLTPRGSSNSFVELVLYAINVHADVGPRQRIIEFEEFPLLEREQTSHQRTGKLLAAIVVLANV